MRVVVCVILAVSVLTMDDLDIDHHHHVDKVSHRIRNLLETIRPIEV